MPKIIEYVLKTNDNIRNLIASSIMICIFTIILIYMNKKEKTIDTFKETVAFMGGTYFMSNISNMPLNYFIKSVGPFIELFDSESVTSQIRTTINRYNSLKHKISKNNNDILILHKEELAHNWKSTTKSTLKYLNFLLTLEEDFINLKNLDEYLLPIDIFLSTIQPNLLDTLKDRVFKPYLSNNYSTTYVPVSPIYIVGESGTGKTRFVKKLSEILDIPIYNLSNFNINNDIYRSYNDFNENSVEIYTKLVYTAKQNKNNSVILFIDEFDKKLMNNSMLSVKIMELINGLSNTKDSYLNYEVKIGNILVICCGNTKLNDLVIENTNITTKLALNNRFVTIEFPALDKHIKKKIIYDYLTKYSHLSIKESEINDTIDNDNEPGVRKLLDNINTLVSKYNGYHIFANTIWNNQNALAKAADQDAKPV